MSPRSRLRPGYVVHPLGAATFLIDQLDSSFKSHVRSTQQTRGPRLPLDPPYPMGTGAEAGAEGMEGRNGINSVLRESLAFDPTHATGRGHFANASKKTFENLLVSRNSNQRRSDHKKREDIPRRDELDVLLVNFVPFVVPFLPL